MLPPPTRLAAWRLLHLLGLLPVIFRFVDVPPGEPDESRSIDRLFGQLSPDAAIPFPLALATAAVQWLWWASPAGSDLRTCFDHPVATGLVRAVRKSLRLSNDECDAMGRTLEGLQPLLADQPPGVATLKRFLARPAADLSRRLLSALAAAQLIDRTRASTLEESLSSLERTEFAPVPLISGDDLTAAGMRPGPQFRPMLDAAYDAQLEGRATTREDALRVARDVLDRR